MMHRTDVKQQQLLAPSSSVTSDASSVSADATTTSIIFDQSAHEQQQDCTERLRISAAAAAASAAAAAALVERPQPDEASGSSKQKRKGGMFRRSRTIGALLFGRHLRQSTPTSSRDGQLLLINNNNNNSNSNNIISTNNMASVHHALIVIFLEYFAWGLLTVPVINVLADTFPANKFLMNGLILGVKGFLSFLSAPLLGALSDTWGRKSFLLLTVFCTCMPIPFLKISPWWYFALFSISGLFSVTFSVVLAYVADITEKSDRSAAYGLVSATFAASLVTSPALGAWISEAWGDEAVVILATAVATLDVLFVLIAVPESLPIHLRQHSMNTVSWHNADPFATLRIVWDDPIVLQLAAIVFLSYLPESGQFSCFFVYLKLVVGFTPEAVAAFIGLVGILSVIAQTGVLLILTQAVGTKHTITLGLCFQFAQLLWYGLGTQYWMMWAAGILAAMSQLTYPSISAFVSVQSDRDKQGTVQGVITGIRGLCQGLGPALFGFIFYQFDMDLNVDNDNTGHVGIAPFPAPRIRPQTIAIIVTAPKRPGNITMTDRQTFNWQLIPGPPFLFGALLVVFALIVNSSLPKSIGSSGGRSQRRASLMSRQSSSADSAKLLYDSS